MNEFREKMLGSKASQFVDMFYSKLETFYSDNEEYFSENGIDTKSLVNMIYGDNINYFLTPECSPNISNGIRVLFEESADAYSSIAD